MAAPQGPQQPAPLLTDFANLYGVTSEEPWKSQGKSGLTPVEPLDPNISDAENKNLRRLTDYQCHVLRGFTSLQLRDSGCLSKSNISRNDLHSPIHPIYMRDQWMPSGETLPAPFNGVRSGTNPVVWNAIRPMLQIASRIIDSSSMWIWYVRNVAVR